VEEHLFNKYSDLDNLTGAFADARGQGCGRIGTAYPAGALIRTKFSFARHRTIFSIVMAARRYMALARRRSLVAQPYPPNIYLTITYYVTCKPLAAWCMFSSSLIANHYRSLRPHAIYRISHARRHTRDTRCVTHYSPHHFFSSASRVQYRART